MVRYQCTAQGLEEGKEAKIQHIIDNRLINKAGGLYKNGLIIANAQVVLEAAKRIAVLDAKAKENTELKKKNDVVKRDGKAQKAHREWVHEGRLVDGDGNPKLNRKSAHVIVRFLLSRVDIKGELKMKDFNSMKACVKWLGEVKRGMTCGRRRRRRMKRCGGWTMKIWQSGQHHCLNWDRSDVVFEQTRLFSIVLLTYRSIIATLNGVIVVIYMLRFGITMVCMH